MKTEHASFAEYKPQLTLENKAKFFAQYYGQKVLNIREKESPVLYVGFDDLMNNNVRETDFLELKPISSISHEDKKQLGMLIGHNANLKESTLIGLGNTIIHVYNAKGLGYISIHSYQYLQSKGYALPWMGLSVDEMVEAGWIKLKE